MTIFEMREAVDQCERDGVPLTMCEDVRRRIDEHEKNCGEVIALGLRLIGLMAATENMI